jgi:hypothetical protein
MATEDSSEPFGRSTEVTLSVRAPDIKSLFAAYRQSLFRVIDPKGLDASVGEKFEEHPATATDI